MPSPLPGRSLPSRVNTVIIGNGPSALLLSYILSGNQPVYRGGCPNPFLHSLLLKTPALLAVPEDRIVEYMTTVLGDGATALPYNRFINLLNHPDGHNLLEQSCIEWHYDPAAAVPHVVIGDLPTAGGQWADDSGSPDVETLSYTELLTLPGYTFEQHYWNVYGKPLPRLLRPLRSLVKDYYATYPKMAGIQNNLFNSTKVTSVSYREGKDGVTKGYAIQTSQSPAETVCKNVVLASGVFTQAIKPTSPELLRLAQRTERPGSPTLHPSPPPSSPSSAGAVLVVGSGYSAADAILSVPPDKPIIHVYKWNASRKSPLHACHQDAYPSYAGIYRLMAIGAGMARKRLPEPFKKLRHWLSDYRGFPNARVLDCNEEGKVRIQKSDGEIVVLLVDKLEYHVGRYGSLEYLSQTLADKLFPVLLSPAGSHRSPLPTKQHLAPPAGHQDRTQPIFLSGLSHNLIGKNGFKSVPNLYIIGSLAGDSLVQFCYGTAIQTASRILQDQFPELTRKEPQRLRISQTQTPVIGRELTPSPSSYPHPPSSIVQCRP